MQIRWKLLAALALMAMPLGAQSSKTRYLRDANHMCRATLADGTAGGKKSAGPDLFDYADS